MTEQMEFCPKCNGIQKMALSLGLMPIETAQGDDILLVYHLHCTACNNYVRSIPLENEDNLLPEEASTPTIPSLV